MPGGAGQPGGVIHFGFRLTSPERLNKVLERLIAIRSPGHSNGGT